MLSVQNSSKVVPMPSQSDFKSRKKFGLCSRCHLALVPARSCLDEADMFSFGYSPETLVCPSCYDAPDPFTLKDLSEKSIGDVAIIKKG